MERINQQGRGFQQGYQRNPQQQQIPASGTLSMGIVNNPAAGENVVREQDRFMPIANVARIMQKGIPYYAKISDDAKKLVQESVSEFISFVTSEAVFRCQNEHRRTITADDLLWAMSNLGFYNYIDPLDFYLNRFREAKGEPLTRRATGVPPTFVPRYYMAPYNAHLGANAMTSMGGFVNDAHNAGPSGAGANRFDP